MQIMIDTNEESRPGLVAGARLLLLAAGIELAHNFFDAFTPEAAGRPPAPPIRPDVRPAAPPAPLPDGNKPVAPVEHPALHPEGTPHVPAVPEIVPAGTPVGMPDLAAGLAIAAALFGGAGAPLAPAVATAPDAPVAPLAGSPDAAPIVGAAALPPASAITSERDSENLPWDDRIHSDTKKKNADGTWRYRRNLDPTIKATVLYELMAVYGKQTAAPMAPQAPPAPTANAAPEAPPAPPAESNVVSLHPAVPVPPATALGVPNAPDAPVVPLTSARQLTQKINTAQGAGLLTPAQVEEALKATGLDSISALFNQPAKVPEVDMYLNRWLAA